MAEPTLACHFAPSLPLPSPPPSPSPPPPSPAPWPYCVWTLHLQDCTIWVAFADITNCQSFRLYTSSSSTLCSLFDVPQNVPSLRNPFWHTSPPHPHIFPPTFHCNYKAPQVQIFTDTCQPPTQTLPSIYFPHTAVITKHNPNSLKSIFSACWHVNHQPIPKFLNSICLIWYGEAEGKRMMKRLISAISQKRHAFLHWYCIIT